MLPVLAIRPKSFRIISTIIMFSDLFFSEFFRLLDSNTSSSNVLPLAIVPFIGIDLITPSSRLKNNSGEAEQIAHSSYSMKAA